MKICSGYIFNVVILYYLILQIDGFKRILSNTDAMESKYMRPQFCIYLLYYLNIILIIFFIIYIDY